jgi:hypothetical protein
LLQEREVATMIALKLIRIGNSIGAVFPNEALAKLRVGEGDTLYLIEAPDGSGSRP